MPGLGLKVFPVPEPHQAQAGHAGAQEPHRAGDGDGIHRDIASPNPLAHQSGASTYERPGHPRGRRTPAGGVFGVGVGVGVGVGGGGGGADTTGGGVTGGGV
jgi:hypothetical protein